MFFPSIYIFASITLDYRYTFYSKSFSEMFGCFTVCRCRALLISGVKIKSLAGWLTSSLAGKKMRVLLFLFVNRHLDSTSYLFRGKNFHSQASVSNQKLLAFWWRYDKVSSFRDLSVVKLQAKNKPLNGSIERLGSIDITRCAFKVRVFLILFK